MICEPNDPAILKGLDEALLSTYIRKCCDGPSPHRDEDINLLDVNLDPRHLTDPSCVHLEKLAHGHLHSECGVPV